MKNTKSTPSQILKQKLNKVDFSDDINKDLDHSYNLEKLQKLADKVRKTFSDEDILRFRPNT